jgi:hypothetical protein
VRVRADLFPRGVHACPYPFIGHSLDIVRAIFAKYLIYLALPRGPHRRRKNNHLAKSGTLNPSTGSLRFLPRVSH